MGSMGVLEGKLTAVTEGPRPAPTTGQGRARALVSPRLGIKETGMDNAAASASGFVGERPPDGVGALQYRG